MIFCVCCRNVCLGVIKMVGSWKADRKHSKKHMAAILYKFGEGDGINWKMKLSFNREEN